MIVVDTWPKLVDALHTPLTRHVMIKPGHWAATEQQTPPVIAKLTGKDRTVVLEGQGYDQVYIMVSSKARQCLDWEACAGEEAHTYIHLPLTSCSYQTTITSSPTPSTP